jgi:hypothetical protein
MAASSVARRPSAQATTASRKRASCPSKVARLDEGPPYYQGVTEASALTPTNEEIAAHLHRVVQLEPSPNPPDWVTENLTFGQLGVPRAW